MKRKKGSRNYNCTVDFLRKGKDLLVVEFPLVAIRGFTTESKIKLEFLYTRIPISLKI